MHSIHSNVLFMEFLSTHFICRFAQTYCVPASLFPISPYKIFICKKIRGKDKQTEEIVIIMICVEFGIPWIICGILLWKSDYWAIGIQYFQSLCTMKLKIHNKNMKFVTFILSALVILRQDGNLPKIQFRSNKKAYSVNPKNRFGGAAAEELHPSLLVWMKSSRLTL